MFLFLGKMGQGRMSLHAEVSDTILNYFQRLFGVSERSHPIDMQVLEVTLPRKIPHTQYEDFAKDVSEEKNKFVLFSLNSNKAPSPNGFNAHFFNKSWNIYSWSGCHCGD